MRRSSVERRLRVDIEERHKLRNQLEKTRSVIARLSQKLGHTKKKRLNSRYSATIERLNAEIKTLERMLNEMNVDLQKRITDEMEFSEEEVQRFKEQYQKEYAGMQEAESKLRAIEDEADETNVEETSDEEPVSKEAMVARTRRMLRRERRIVEEIQREISSEERDRALFVRELQQIMAELEAYIDSQ